MQLTLKSLAMATLLLSSLSQYSYAGVVSGSDDASSSTTTAVTTNAASTSTNPTASSGSSTGSSSEPASTGSTATGSSAAATASSTSSGNSSSNSTSSSGPQFVIYSLNTAANGLPDVSDVEGYTVFAISFLLSTGAKYLASDWAALDSATRQKLKQQYNQAGIKVVVSAFGSEEQPTTSGNDAANTAQTMAKWVIDNDLDGIDVDYEDLQAMSAADGKAEEWLATFTKTLRETLPQGKYLLTHAPLAPWFDKSMYASGAYMTVHQDVGDMIDWYNIQYYNQGDYTTCDTLVEKSAKYPGSALKEIAANGIPQQKLIAGKPATTADATRDYVDPSTLATCLKQAKDEGWTGGAMVWQYPDANAQWIKTVRAQSWPVGSS